MVNEDRPDGLFGIWLKTSPIRAINPQVCPHLILIPSHYREDGACRCDDPKEKIMRSWGYTWSRTKKRWV